MSSIKLFVDDIRNAPDNSWVVSRTVSEAIRTIAQWDIEEISLDHDISHQVAIGRVSRPYPCDECFCAVAYFMGLRYSKKKEFNNVEITVANNPPKITLHTSNPVGAEKMKNILKDYHIDCVIKLSGISNRLETEV